MSVISRETEDNLRQNVIRGYTVLCGNHERILHAESGGSSSITQPDSPITSDTVIDIASISKVVATTTSLLILEERGLVDPDAPFTEYLPDFDAYLYRPVTIRELACHISGFINLPVLGIDSYCPGAGRALKERFLHEPPFRPPCQVYEYSCWNFHLITLILERLLGKSETFPEFVKKEIFTPLEMNDTGFGAVPDHVPTMRRAETLGPNQRGAISDPPANFIFREGFATGNAGVFSTANDLAKFCQCILNRGECRAGRLFGDRFLHEITTNHVPEKLGVRRGIGWVLSDENRPAGFPDGTIYHSGWSGQTVTIDTQSDFFTIVLTTRCGDYIAAKKTRRRLAEIMRSEYFK